METQEQNSGGLTPEQEALVRGDGLELPPDPMQMEFNFPEEGSEASEGASEASQEAEDDDEGFREPEKVETPTEPAKEPTQPKPEPQDDRFSENLARIARMEQELRQEREAIRKERDELGTYRELAEAAKSGSKLRLLDRLGVTYDDITNEYINGDAPRPEEKLRSEIEQTRESLSKELQEIREYHRQQQLAQERQHMRNTISQADGFEVIKGLEAFDLVENAVQQHYREHGEILSYEDAARAVEDGIGELLTKALSIESVRERFRQQFASDPGESRVETRREDTARTLSNEDTQDRTLLVDDDFDPITASDEELIERLAPKLVIQP